MTFEAKHKGWEYCLIQSVRSLLGRVKATSLSMLNDLLSSRSPRGGLIRCFPRASLAALPQEIRQGWTEIGFGCQRNGGDCVWFDEDHMLAKRRGLLKESSPRLILEFAKSDSERP